MRPLTALPVALAVLLSAAAAQAQWALVTQPLEGAQVETTLARIRNDSGHVLELYRDGAAAIRARFTLPEGQLAFAEGYCPTMQVDRWQPVNRSINDASCLTTTNWAEFVVGFVLESKVQSDRLLQFMNGNLLTVRYRLAGGDYRDTQFSLAGSKRSLGAAIGADVVVTAR